MNGHPSLGGECLLFGTHSGHSDSGADANLSFRIVRRSSQGLSMPPPVPNSGNLRYSCGQGEVVCVKLSKLAPCLISSP